MGKWSVLTDQEIKRGEWGGEQAVDTGGAAFHAVFADAGHFNGIGKGQGFGSKQAAAQFFILDQQLQFFSLLIVQQYLIMPKLIYPHGDSGWSY